MKRPVVRKTFVLIVSVWLFAAVVSSAEEVQRSTSFSVEGAYYLPDNKGYGVDDGGFAPITYSPVSLPGTFASIPGPSEDDEGRDLGSSWGPAEIQALITHRIAVPFLAGSGALTSGNNVTFALTGALTPVSARLEVQAKLTPIAFLNIYAGGMIGTGWDIGLFNGMGLNAGGSGVAQSASFQGVVVKSQIGGTFQFDLAAVVPGEWTHVVTMISPELEYAAFSGAEEGEAWLWEADDAENFNGFKFNGAYFLGYQMPLVLNTVGVLVETEQNLGYVKELSPMAAEGWGSDHVQITVSPLFNFTLSDSSSLAVLLQLRRERLYKESDESIFANYYENRHAVGTYWDFYRIAFSYSLQL